MAHPAKEDEAVAGQEEVAAAGREEAAPAPAAHSSAGSVRAPPPASARGRPREGRTATAAPQPVVRAGLASGGWPEPAPPSPPRRSPGSDSERRACWRRNTG
jgi:hypothetical protein